jgi:hypothetical protein
MSQSLSVCRGALKVAQRMGYLSKRPDGTPSLPGEPHCSGPTDLSTQSGLRRYPTPGSVSQKERNEKSVYKGHITS